MNALQSYSSDNESEEEPVLRKMNKAADSGTNYDNVGMDISEDSGDEADPDRVKPAYQKSTNNNNTVRPDLILKNDSSSSPESDRGAGAAAEATKESEKNNIPIERSKGRVSEEKHKDRRHSSSNSRRERSREKNNRDSDRTSRDVVKDSRDNRDSRRSTDSRDYRRGGRTEDRRPSRRSRSRSRDRRRSRSRSRSRDRDRRKRRTRTRSRSRSRSRERERERKRPHEIRKEAQQKLAAFKASNPNFDHNEMLKRGMEAQFAEVQKNTGVTLPSYYNPATMNPLKIAEQERKKKLLWGNKNKPVEAAVPTEPIGGSADLWVNTKFSNDSDGKMAEKFKRLMGVRPPGAPSTTTNLVPEMTHDKERDSVDNLQKQESMFNSMEKQYEVARLATHTHKGFGLGFTSQSYLPK